MYKTKHLEKIVEKLEMAKGFIHPDVEECLQMNYAPDKVHKALDKLHAGVANPEVGAVMEGLFAAYMAVYDIVADKIVEPGDKVAEWVKQHGAIDVHGSVAEAKIYAMKAKDYKLAKEYEIWAYGYQGAKDELEAIKDALKK